MKLRNIHYLSVLPALVLFLILPGSLYSQDNIVKRELPGYGLVEFFDDQVIVRYRDGVSRGQMQAVNEQFRSSPVTQAGESTVHLLRLDDMSVEEALHNLSQRPEVLYVEPNLMRRRIEPVELFEFSVTGLQEQDVNGIDGPDDEFFEAQWALKNEGQTLLNTDLSGTPGADIKAYLAWELTQGSEDVIVAVFDSGIDSTHPDLTDNMFLDSEGNFGIDCSPDTLNENDGECGFDIIDRSGHGTHVAGIIGAVGDNEVGITGVNWRVRLMAVKIFNDNGTTNTEAIVKGFEYALANGATISNHSYGGYGFSQSEFDAFEGARNNSHLVVTASANNGWNNDNEVRAFPGSYDLDNIISVAATTFDDELALFSNYGINSVHIAAPGVFIASTFPDNNYVYASGTSMASPHVAGVAALVKALEPAAGSMEIRNRILNRADQLESLDGVVMGSRRLNAFTALIDDDGTSPAAITDLNYNTLGQSYAGLEWTAVGYSGNTGFAKSYDIRISQSPITADNFDQAEVAEEVVIPLNAGELQTHVLRNLSAGTTYYVALKAEDFFENKSEISNVLQFTTVSSPALQATYQGIDTSLNTGEMDTFPFLITNTGVGTLDLQIQDRFMQRSLADDDPETFPYIITNSFEDRGPAFSWEEIGDIGEVVNFSNSRNGVQAVELPFAFPFYGIEKTEVHISVNGFLSFGPITSIAESGINQQLPSGLAPNDIIAVHWSDLDLADTGRVITYYDGENEQFIVQWDRLSLNSSSLLGRAFPTFQVYTFQVILYKGGTIKKQYLELEPSTRFLSVGIENQQGNTGELFAFNQLNIHEGMALTYLPAQPEWLEISDTSIQLETGESKEVELTLNAKALLAGNYYTEIFFLDNDMLSDPLRIPVHLSVEGQSTFIRFIHNSLDPELQRFDIFLNERLFVHNLFYNNSSDLIEVPAGVDMTFEIITENSESRSDAIVQKVVHFEPDKEIMAVMSGMGKHKDNAVFDLYIREFDDTEVNSENVRLIILNSVTGVDHIGLFGYYPNDLPPLHILNELPFGQFTEYVIDNTRNMELDVIHGQDLLDSFRFDIRNLGGETILLVATGFANPEQDEPGIEVFANSEANDGIQLQKITNEDQVARHIPEQFDLRQNYPNPFNPTTNILFRLPEAEHVRIVIYDVLGRPVQTLLNRQFQPGIHTVTFDGSRLSSGLYFYRIQAGNEIQTKKMLLIK